MPPVHVPRLLGTYGPINCRAGSELPGVVCGRTGLVNGPHRVRGLTDAPIIWPWTVVSGSRHQLIVTGDLEAALRRESVLAVSYYWSVSAWWVNRARRMLGIERMTEGTTALWRELTPTRLGDPRKYRPLSRVTQKVSDAQIKQIRRRRQKGESAAALAAEFGLTRQYVSLIAAGRVRRP
jgi:hypothetical protein